MAIKTPQQFIESLRDDRVVYFLGEQVRDVTTHPYMRITIDWAATDYVLENDPRYQDLMTYIDNDGERVPFIFSAIKSKEDMLRLREVVKVLARTCLGKPAGAKFVGKDGLNSVTVASRRIDKKYGTHYTENVENYRKYLQKNDLALALAMTDIKGDRMLRPSQQVQHKDFYVHITKETADGVYVSGAKTHISHAPTSNELIVLPCRTMREDDKDYAIAFGVPANAKGITYISTEPENKEVGNWFDYPISGTIYINDATVIFDNVFIPNERIFLKREWEFAADVAYMFGTFHRLSAETYKAAELEIVAGAAALMAEYNGIEKAPHVQDKLAWLVDLAESVEVLGQAACEHPMSDTGSGLVYPNIMIANICKYHFADNWHQATKYLQDIGGGVIATVPSEKDYKSPATHDLMEKYFGAKAGIPTENRLRMIRLIKDMTSAYEDVLTIHAEGSLAAQKIMILQGADFPRYKAAARRAARIVDGTNHPLYDELPVYPPKT